VTVGRDAKNLAGLHAANTRKAGPVAIICSCHRVFRKHPAIKPGIPAEGTKGRRHRSEGKAIPGLGVMQGSLTRNVPHQGQRTGPGIVDGKGIVAHQPVERVLPGMSPESREQLGVGLMVVISAQTAFEFVPIVEANDSHDAARPVLGD
jgi:hypothetical protein